jgi:ubiquinone biosynthesis UbiH/UbiF/VisC/COQ6 family hydroxylase
MKHNDLVFDVVILGGNMVGAVCALALQRSGLRIALVEKATVPSLKSAQEPTSTRVSAVIRSVEYALKNLGVWQKIAPARIQPFFQMRVWESSAPHRPFVFDAGEACQPNLGHILENDQIQAAAWSVLREHNQVTCFESHTVESLHPTCEGVQCHLSSGVSLQAKLLVGADGLHSETRKMAGIGLSVVDYHQSVIVGNVYPERHHQQACWQNYRPQGPFAFLPLADGGCSIAWYMPPHEIERVMQMTDEDFCQAIFVESEGVLGAIRSVKSRASFELKKRHAEAYAKERVVLIGDAAHTVHPMAGQGANLGILDALTLAQEVGLAARSGEAFWSAHVLQRYANRRLDNYVIQQSMDLFASGFKPLPGPLSWLRARVLGQMNQFKPLKSALVSYAVGEGRDLPQLAQRLDA